MRRREAVGVELYSSERSFVCTSQQKILIQLPDG